MFSLFPSSLTPFRRFYFYVYRFAFLLETNICARASLLKNGRCVNRNRVEYMCVCVCVQIYAMYTSTLLCSCSCYKNLLKISHTQINITYQLDYITERNHFQYLCDFSKHFRHYFSPHLQHYFNNTHYQRESVVAALLPFLSVGLSNATPGDRGALIDRPCFVFLSVFRSTLLQTDGWPLHACPWPDNLLLNKTRMSKLLITHNAACLVCLYSFSQIALKSIVLKLCFRFNSF